MKKLAIIIFSLIFISGCGNNPAPSDDYAQKITDHTLNNPSTTVLTQSANPSTEPTTSESTVSAQFSQVPVLMFHYIRTVDKTKDLLGYNLSYEPALFAKLLDALDKAGYKTIHPSDLLDSAQNKLPTKPIILTFDDGYEDFLTNALPELNKHHFTAVEAIIVDKMTHDISGQTYLSPTQVKQIDQQGIDIFSHTQSHIELSKATPTKQRQELSDSKIALEKLLGHSVTGVVYPSGKYSKTTLAITKQLGYQIAFTTAPGLDSSTENLLKLQRIRVDNRRSLQSILKEL